MGPAKIWKEGVFAGDIVTIHVINITSARILLSNPNLSQQVRYIVSRKHIRNPVRNIVCKMASLNVHLEKYKLFKQDAENEDNSIPTRIEAIFEACFHLIEACMAKEGLHINKHNRVRSMVAAHDNIFGDGSESVWRAFQELENQIRPGQAYGGRIDGPQLERAQNIMDRIESVCNTVLQNT